MSSKKEDESDEDEEEEGGGGEGEGKKGSKPPEKNVTYVGGIKLSDARRTTLAYVSAVFSLTGLILAIFLFINGLREDSYLSEFSDLVKGYSGGGIFTLMMVMGVAAGVIQLCGCHICFRATISVERRKLYYWLWVYMMALLGLLVAFVVADGVALIYWLTAHSAFKGGMHGSMKLYESRLKVKTTIDRMQIDFKCCGSHNYQDWWNVGWWGVRWLDVNSKEVQKKMKDGRTYLTDSVPFSCCDPRVRRPCVHHSMLSSFQHTKYDSSNVTVYEHGCTRAMSKHYASTVSGFLKLLIAALAVQLALTVTFRYLQTSTGAAVDEGDMDAEARGYLWAVSSKPKEAKPDDSGEKGRGKASKSPSTKKSGTSKRGSSKAEEDENRNNVAPNNNRLGTPGNYSNTAVRQKPQSRTSMVPSRDRTLRQPPPPTVSRLPSTATVAGISRQTSATYVGSSRQTSGTRLAAATSRDSDVIGRASGAMPASRQQSQNSVATSQLTAVTSGTRASTGTGSHVSVVRRAPPSSSQNVNINAAPDGSQTSVAGQQRSASDVIADVHHPCLQQLPVNVAVPQSVHVTQSDAEPPHRPEVPRPLTPIPTPGVHRSTVTWASSTRLPRSVPLADFLGSQASHRQINQTGSTPGNLLGTSGGDRTRGPACTTAAMQAPLLGIHGPVGSMAGIHAGPPTNRVAVPPTSSVPPPLPPRTVSAVEDSPYVMLYPLRPPRASQPLSRPRTK